MAAFTTGLIGKNKNGGSVAAGSTTMELQMGDGSKWLDITLEYLPNNEKRIVQIGFNSDLDLVLKFTDHKGNHREVILIKYSQLSAELKQKYFT